MTHVARIIERVCKNGDTMTENKNKNNEARRYSREHDETYLSFVTRIINTEDKPMTVDEICDKMDGATRSVRSDVLWHASCSDAVRRGWIEKTRCFHVTNGRNRTHYHPTWQHPIGDDIPRPLYHKKGTISEPIDYESMNDYKEHRRSMNAPVSTPENIEDDIQLANDAQKTVQAWDNLNGEQRTAVLHLLKSPIKATRTHHVFNAVDLIDTLHAINTRLYEQVLDTIGDAIGVNGTWSRTTTEMVYKAGEQV